MKTYKVPLAGETPRADAYGEVPLPGAIHVFMRSHPAECEDLLKVLRGWSNLARQLERELAEAKRATIEAAADFTVLEVRLLRPTDGIGTQK